MNIEIDNHKLLTGVLTAALIGLGTYFFREPKEIEANKDNIVKVDDKLTARIDKVDDKLTAHIDEMEQKLNDYLNPNEGKETD